MDRRMDGWMDGWMDGRTDEDRNKQKNDSVQLRTSIQPKQSLVPGSLKFLPT